MDTPIDSAKDFTRMTTRGCGRTESMLRHAEFLASGGACVWVVFPTARQRDMYRDRLTGAGVRSLGTLDASSLRGVQGVVLYDHSFYEALLGQVEDLSNRLSTLCGSLSAMRGHL